MPSLTWACSHRGPPGSAESDAVVCLHLWSVVQGWRFCACGGLRPFIAGRPTTHCISLEGSNWWPSDSQKAPQVKAYPSLAASPAGGRAGLSRVEGQPHISIAVASKALTRSGNSKEPGSLDANCWWRLGLPEH